MSLENYSLDGVKPEEFAVLERQTASIVGLVKKKYLEQIARGVKVMLGYDSANGRVGISVQRLGRFQPVTEREDLGIFEWQVVEDIYRAIEIRLAKIRLPKGSS